MCKMNVSSSMFLISSEKKRQNIQNPKDQISSFWILKRAWMCVHAHVTHECMNQNSDMQSYAAILFRLSVCRLFFIIFVLLFANLHHLYVSHTNGSALDFLISLYRYVQLMHLSKYIGLYIFQVCRSWSTLHAVQNSNALLAGLLHFFVIFDFSRAVELKIQEQLIVNMFFIKE